MVNLFSLIPQPIRIKTGSITGKLLVNGNIEYNAIQFRFRFIKTQETVPVRLSICVGGKTYCYYCTILKNAPKEIITPVFSPEFNINQCFTIRNIEPIPRFFIKINK